MSSRKILLGLIGLSLVGQLMACGRVQQAHRPELNPWPNGTAQVTFTQYGLTDTYVYGRRDLSGKEYGVVCQGKRNKDGKPTEIEINFVEALPKRGKGDVHLTVIGSHPDGPNSKATDLPAATFKLRNWPPNGKTRKSDVYEKSANGSACKLTYRKEGHRGIGTFDCQGFGLMADFERNLRSEHAIDPAFAPAPIRIQGEFNCYVFEDEEPTGPLSAPEKPADFRDRNWGQAPSPRPQVRQN